MKTALINSQSDTQGGVHFLYFVRRKRADVVREQRFRNTDQIITKTGIWYDSTSIASAFSLSAFLLIISMSLASDLCIGSLPAGAGVKAIIVLPAGTSGGTSIVSLRLAGTSTVCVMLITAI
jgi:hypothetical protein